MTFLKWKVKYGNKTKILVKSVQLFTVHRWTNKSPKSRHISCPLLCALNLIIPQPSYLILTLQFIIYKKKSNNFYHDFSDVELPPAPKDPTYIEKRNRCLGKYWEHIPVLVLIMEKLDENSRESEEYTQIKVTVMSSNNVKNENCQCILKLSAMGITD